MLNFNQKNKTIITASIIFGLFIFLNLPVKAAQICCEVRYNISDSRPTEYRFVQTESECSGTTSNPRYFIVDNIKLCEKPAQEAIKTTPIIPPVLSVSIPGFDKFSEVTCDSPETPCEIPWLADYIKALYKYSVTIISLLAVVVMMVGGVLWLTAGGNKERISSGMNFIKGGVMGIIIALSSYAILFILSPNLVILNPLSISYIKNEELPDLDLSKTAEELNISNEELSSLKGENPYQAGCGNIEKCKQFGNSLPSGLVSIEAKYGSGLINPKTYEAFKKAMDCLPTAYQGKFVIGNSQRTAARQIELKAKKGKMAASPCCSNHGSGSAMDINRKDGIPMSWDYNDKSGLKKCMNQNGLYAKLRISEGSSIDEPWHFSPSGR